jgi:hypothetical protein
MMVNANAENHGEMIFGRSPPFRQCFNREWVAAGTRAVCLSRNLGLSEIRTPLMVVDGE